MKIQQLSITYTGLNWKRVPKLRIWQLFPIRWMCNFWIFIRVLYFCYWLFSTRTPISQLLGYIGIEVIFLVKTAYFCFSTLIVCFLANLLASSMLWTLIINYRRRRPFSLANTQFLLCIILLLVIEGTVFYKFIAFLFVYIR